MRRGLFFCATLLLAFVVGCDSLPGKPREEDRPIRKDQIKDFAVLWQTQCAGCHGADGTMGAARSLNDPLYLAWVSDQDLRVVIQQGVAGSLMPAFAEGHGGMMTDAQIEIVIDQMRKRWGSAPMPGLPPYAASLGDAGRGAVVYREFCSGCHGPDGTGGTVRGSIVEPAFLALVSDQSLRSSVVAGRTDLGMPSFKDVVPGKTMTAEQISDVVAWIAGHRVEFPGQPFAREEADNG
ncbi:MAG: c-type cytochrome [Myxococcota bacterium]|nr:c-type cytochrome [Myxococcota bacterium]